jgi:hypothetical protein
MSMEKMDVRGDPLPDGCNKLLIIAGGNECMSA